MRRGWQNTIFARIIRSNQCWRNRTEGRSQKSGTPIPAMPEGAIELGQRVLAPGILLPDRGVLEPERDPQAVSIRWGNDDP